MRGVRSYRWGANFFGLVLAASSAFLPHALSCCSRFSNDDLALKASFGVKGWAPGITPLVIALLDWPMGFRLLVLIMVAASLCFVATVAGLLILRRMQRDGGEGGSVPLWFSVSEAVLGSLMVGVLYIVAAYATGYVGYIGPRNALWFVGVPMAVALIQQERPSRALLWTFPLLLGGWLSMGILSITVGIPLD